MENSSYRMQRGSGRQTRFIRGVSGPCLGTGNNCTCFQVAFACVLCLGQRAGCGRKRRCLLWLCLDQRHCHRRHCCNVYGRCKRRSSLRCSRSGGGEGNIRPGNPGPIEQRHAVPPLSLHSSPQPQPPHVQLRSPHSQRSPQSPQLRPRNSHPATSRVPAPRLRLSPPNNPRPNRPSRPRPPRRSRLQPPPPSRSFADSKPSCHGRRQAAPRRTCGCRCTVAPWLNTADDVAADVRLCGGLPINIGVIPQVLAPQHRRPNHPRRCSGPPLRPPPQPNAHSVPPTLPPRTARPGRQPRSQHDAAHPPLRPDRPPPALGCRDHPCPPR